MARLSWRRASVRFRTTAAAVLVVAIVLLVGGLVLVALVRAQLRDGVETTAEQRAEALVDQIATSGVPAPGRDDDADDPDDAEPDDDGEDDFELEEVVWQVLDADGRLVSSSQPLRDALPSEDADAVDLPGGDSDYVVVTEDAEGQGGRYDVTVAVSLEDVDDSVSALVGPLSIGLPLVLLLLGGTTWMVVTRALAPVERIRREADQITGDRLDRRVTEPDAHDEIHRLARTMNLMLGRLEDSRARQQQFVGDASHELRSPLASIRQTAEVAVAHPGALPEGELAAAVLEESARMQRLVEQLLLLTRADQGAVTRGPREVDLDDLVLAEARRVARQGVTVDTSGVTAARIRGDEVALSQVVRNLVDNAVRHAVEVVALSVREVPAGVELVVDDDGSGVPDDQRHRVFERFVRLDEARSRDAGGSGLGLAIVHDVVTAHGGTVVVDRSPRGGARFVVLLPAPAAT